jgi:hypothetical protein
VAKVKKRTGVTGERNAKRKAAGRKAHRGSKTAKRGVGKQAASRKRPGSGTKPVAIARKEAGVVVKALDPLRKCGPNTTVQFLYRVDEEVDGRSTAHLVFFDRHGWYCEHGRACPAVAYARKQSGHIARVS